MFLAWQKTFAKLKTAKLPWLKVCQKIVIILEQSLQSINNSVGMKWLILMVQVGCLAWIQPTCTIQDLTLTS